MEATKDYKRPTPNITDAELKEAVRATEEQMSKWPTLCASGFGISNFNPGAPDEVKQATLKESREELAEVPEEVATAIAFLRLCLPSRTTSSRSPGSYGLKHDAERWGQSIGRAPYVCNGALIVAALHLGFPVSPDGGHELRRLGRVGPNAGVGVTRRSLLAVIANGGVR